MIALGLLSTLFLLARAPAEPPDISFAEIEAMARDQRITAPRFSGVTDDGSVISIAARSRATGYQPARYGVYSRPQSANGQRRWQSHRHHRHSGRN
uniref:Uncharacterized protein n=1 Tax=Yoonia rhodophyticola TaxID=3137370 RepID=A0AAN0MF35_9RHOB